MTDTPKTDEAASDAWSGDAVCVSADFARELERENNRLRAALLDEGMAHEIWTLAQLLPGEGIVEGVNRVNEMLTALANVPVRRIGLWQVGCWHEPKRDDPRFDGHLAALAAAQSKSLKDDTALFCVWEWDDGARHATERFLFINGQAWQPAERQSSDTLGRITRRVERRLNL